MYRIDTPTAAASLPAPDAAGSPGYFAHAPAGSGNTPTVVSSDWLNGIQEELMAFLTHASIAPDKTLRNQLLTSVLSIISSAGVNGSGSIFGMILSNTSGATTTKISVSAGLCRDSTNTADLPLAAPVAKDLTATWVAGDGNGGRLVSTALANGQTWFVFAILNPTSGVVDFGFDQSPTAPTLPAGYTKFRRLGAILLEAASTSIRQFTQTGDWFKLKTRSADYAVTANGAGPYLRSISVPVGIRVEAEMYFQSTGTAGLYLSGIYDPGDGAPAAFGGSTQWAQVRRIDYLSNTQGGYQSYGTVVCRQYTDTAGKVYTYSSDTSDVIALGVLGWRDERGKFY